jgi:CheY-like chemotaxis protein
VRAAGTAGQALALLDEAADRGQPFDLVLLDNALPDVPGERLGPRILAEPRYARPGLILAAASGMRGDAARAGSAGFAAYLTKPVDAETLLGCLRAVRAGAGAGQVGGDGAAGLITAHTVLERRQPALDVLVADDNAVNRRLATIILERAGHRVTLVENGLEAVAALERRAFDMILMDVRMPVMDGLAATARIRALPDPALAGTPVVAVTANAMRGDDDACFAAGMDGYVTKPVTMANLGEAIARHARRPAFGTPPSKLET